MQKYVLFIGIDISKNWIDVCLTLDGQKKQMPHMRVCNAKEGFRQLIRFIERSGHCSTSSSKWLFCMEHTGVYTYRLCRFLSGKNMDYTLVNPLELKYSLGLRRGKSDAADAADIARFAFMNRQELEPTPMPSDQLLLLKSLLSLRNRLVKHKRSMQVAAMELEDYAPKRVSRPVVKYSAKNVKQLKDLKKKVEKQIRQVISQDPQLNELYELLLSVKGVGPVIGTALIVYTAAFTAFKTSRQFAVYIGLAPFEQSSGSSLHIPAKVSHLAHKKIKGWISSGSLAARTHDRQLRAYYERRIAEGKNKYAVQNAVRNKFLHRIFAVVKRGTPYVELELHQN